MKPFISNLLAFLFESASIIHDSILYTTVEMTSTHITLSFVVRLNSLFIHMVVCLVHAGLAMPMRFSIKTPNLSQCLLTSKIAERDYVLQFLVSHDHWHSDSSRRIVGFSYFSDVAVCSISNENLL